MLRLVGLRISAVRRAARCDSHHDGVQFWKMDVGIYEHGTPPYGPPLSPEFCLGHWQTQCRSAICPSPIVLSACKHRTCISS